MRYRVSAQFHLHCQWTGVFRHIDSLFYVICLAGFQFTIEDIFVSEIINHTPVFTCVSTQLHFVTNMFHMN